ncbi:hypothetical protein B0T22DRAFT_500752 [Podospora appendiculata]|uniref:Meiotically up-regulated 65 protein n=1 Tax=Podospora appendiculata TaxID=314037 RepID=A0AAE1CB01_9PEZI|nr:hypothetical protein B0T22DRAFT_500752 [Podospora appendiculata]
MPSQIKPRSSRRAPPPKDSDFDHEIGLVDNCAPAPRTSAQDQDGDSILPAPTQEGAVASLTDAVNSGVAPDDEGTKGKAAAADAADAAPPAVSSTVVAGEGPSVQIEQPTPLAQPDRSRSRTRSSKARSKTQPESAIDILYENQRGGFLCGMPLFSSKALGNLDPPPWTNYAHHASPTDITNAQVPDPSWEWAWPEWRINHDEGVDEDGWEYSFMFSKKFSWHKASWWNSFVRRRAWIRKRVKKDSGYLMQDSNMLTPEYFSVRGSAELDRSTSRGASQRGSKRGSKRGSRPSMSTDTFDDAADRPDIETVEGLLQVLRKSRIDREKIEAVDNYLAHSDEDLEGLQDVMHEVMSIFVFQASRRALLTRLTEVHDQTVEQQKKEDTPGRRKRVENLEATIHHADEEVRRLEYWSDKKSVAEEGGSMGAVDQSQGWDRGWQGLDKSGPSEPKPQHAAAAET